MANITKKGKQKYLVRVSKQSNGRRKFHNFTFRGTLEKAKEFARTKETQMDLGELDRTELTFKEYFEMWIKAVTPKLSPRTIDGYEGTVNRYAMATLEKMNLNDIRNHHIQSIYLAMDKSPTTVRNLHASLRACFSYAKRREYISVNPCTHIDLPARSTKQISVLDFKQARALVQACAKATNGLIFEFALETGMRPEEYLALRWSDLDGNEASVQQIVQYNRSGGGFYFDTPKTKKSRRRVPISEPLRKRVARHRTEQLKHRIGMKGTWFDNDLIFPNEVGNPFALNNLTIRYFHPILEAAELKGLGITLYSLRHTCATLLLMSNENPKVVADRLGHSTVTITLDTYSHVLPHIQADATETLRNIMRG